MTTPEPLTRKGLVPGMSDVEYHGGPEFSASAAKELLQSPARYKDVYIDGNKKASKAFDVGTAAHTKVLGTGQPAVPYPEEVLAANGAASTTAAKTWAREQRDAGMVPVKQDEFDAINAMAEAVLAFPDARALLELPGEAEASVFATDPETGLDMRCRFDYLPFDYALGVDLKSTRDASLRGFTRTIEDFLYDVQWGHYVETANFAGLEVHALRFIAVESARPYGVNVIDLDPEWSQMALVRSRYARRRLIECREADDWPAYPPGVKVASPPPWVINKYQDDLREGMEDTF